MHEAHLLRELVLLLGLAAAGAALFERLNLPSIAGFLVMGTLAGPGGLGVTSDPAGIQAIAEFGVVFLLFEIGLELPLERVRRLLRVGLTSGALQVGGTLLLVMAGGLALGLPPRTAIVVGALAAMSSTALVIRLLGERGEIDAPHGQVAVSVLLFQDLCIVPFLLAIPILASDGPIEAWPVAGAVLRAVVAVGAFYLAARFALPRLLAAAASLRSREVFSLVAVLVVVGAAFAAEAIGLTAAVGAFLAGLVLTSSPWGPQLLSEVLPLRGLLLGVFFTAVGMLLDPRAAWANAGTVML
ncbi:MAG: cation:proton antiporter, partial [Myxococcota bacterium]